MAGINLMPGPVAVLPEVREAFAREPVSHRCEQFKRQYRDTIRRLKRLVNARRAVLLAGSGTLGNEIAAWNLRGLGPGLVLSNGEFGERLAGHASRHGLDFETLRLDWGGCFAMPEVARRLEGKSWVWLAACETSTGVLNPFQKIAAHCGARGIKVCLDCISAAGNTPLDLSDVFMATASSGKGQGAYAGIAVIFYNHAAAPSPGTPGYLDLATHQNRDNVPFTLLSSLLSALHAALVHTDYAGKFKRLRAMRARVRALARRHNLASPVRRGQSDFMWTFQLPAAVDSEKTGDALARRGILAHYKNKYLLQRNWVQFSLMGCVSAADVGRAFGLLAQSRAAAAPRA